MGVNFLGFKFKCVSNNIVTISWISQFSIPKCRFSHVSTPTNIQDHSMNKTPFPKKKNFAVEVLGMCLPSIKRYFLEHQWSALLFLAQITQILLFSRMPFLGRSEIIVWEQHFSKKKVSMEVLRLCLPYVKRHLQEHQWSAFLF